MRIETSQLYDGENTFTISPDEGKELFRISDGSIFRDTIQLGYHYNAEGEFVKEVPADFGERDITPEEDVTEEDVVEEPTSYLDEYEYKELTEKYIRQRYSISEEFAVLRQRDTKPDDFQQYYDYCEECKAKAKEEATHNYI